MTETGRVPVFDLDGTLLDSDEALVAPFVASGVAVEDVHRGRPLAEECAAHGVAVADFLAAYDTDAAPPFPGVEAMLAEVGEWGACSNKHPESARAELARLGWSPAAAHFAGDDHTGKDLGRVIRDLGVGPDDAVFVGDTEHDRLAARMAGCTFVLAAWNPRVEATGEGLVAHHPSEVPALLRR